MAGKRDYYEVLGVAREASAKDIAAAYRKLAIKYHPDSNPGDEDATEHFKEAAQAYEILGDAEKRARYDRYGHAGVEGVATHFDGVQDILDHFFGGGIFDGLFGGGGRARRKRRGADLRCDVTLTLEEAALGAKKTVEFTRSKLCDECEGAGTEAGSERQTCRRCGGAGQVEVVSSSSFFGMRSVVRTSCNVCQGTGSVIVRPCKKCRGHGYVAGKVTRDVNIPAGVDDGTPLRLNGEGEPSPDGGPPGHCYCVISVKPHPIFQRRGQDLYVEVPITYSQAALGATIEIPTLEGADELEIPRGTESGAVFRRRGKGMPDPHGGARGELLVQTYIETPKKLTKQQEKLLRELAELEHANVSPRRKSFLQRIRDYMLGDGESEEQN